VAAPVFERQALCMHVHIVLTLPTRLTCHVITHPAHERPLLNSTIRSLSLMLNLLLICNVWFVETPHISVAFAPEMRSYLPSGIKMNASRTGASPRFCMLCIICTCACMYMCMYVQVYMYKFTCIHLYTYISYTCVYQHSSMNT